MVQGKGLPVFKRRLKKRWGGGYKDKDTITFKLAIA
jgi:hypothetical protein